MQTYFYSSSCPFLHCPQCPLSIPPVVQGAAPRAAPCPATDHQCHGDGAHQLAPCFRYCHSPQSVCGSHVYPGVKMVPLVAQLCRLCAALSRSPPNSCRGYAAHCHTPIGRVCLCEMWSAAVPVGQRKKKITAEGSRPKAIKERNPHCRTLRSYFTESLNKVDYRIFHALTHVTTFILVDEFRVLWCTHLPTPFCQ